MSAYFFWSAWSAVAHRPDEAVSYTNNWPHVAFVFGVGVVRSSPSRSRYRIASDGDSLAIPDSDSVLALAPLFALL